MTTQSPPEQPQSQERSILHKFLNEKQDPAIVKQVHTKVSEILTSGEEILYIAVQNKPVLNITPDCVVLTNKRFIIYRPKLLGRVDFEDYIWRALRNARLKEGIMGATLTMSTVKGRKLSIEYLPKKQARRVYSVAQAMEEKMLEERRMRKMEETRAAAGGVTLQTPAQAAPAAAPPPPEDPIKKLGQLKSMLEADLITADEYEEKKTEILARM